MKAFLWFLSATALGGLRGADDAGTTCINRIGRYRNREPVRSEH